MNEEKRQNLVAARPTESATVVAGAVVGLLIGYGLIPPELAGHWAVILGTVPGIVTTIVVYFTRKK